MKAEAPAPVLLKDYRPPSYLIDSVDLDIALNPTETRVRSRLKMRPNPAAKGKPGALVLNGEHLTLETVRLDLLRLQVGVGSVEHITRELAAATAVGEEADRLEAGRREVEAVIARGK